MMECMPHRRLLAKLTLLASMIGGQFPTRTCIKPREKSVGIWGRFLMQKHTRSRPLQKVASLGRVMLGVETHETHDLLLTCIKQNRVFGSIGSVYSNNGHYYVPRTITFVIHFTILETQLLINCMRLHQIIDFTDIYFSRFQRDNLVSQRCVVKMNHFLRFV